MKISTCLLACAIGITAVKAQESPALPDDAIDGVNVVRTVQYDKDALWGYMNGGADLYLEYGFENLTVQTFRGEDADFKAEIYKMSSPEAGYGIFSVSRFRCSETRVVLRTDCLTDYQYLAAKGSYYVSVSNTTGSLKEREISLKIGQKILEDIESSGLQRPGLFHIDMLADNLDRLMFMSGPLGMQNGFMKWDEMFTGFLSYEAWIMPFEFQESQFTLAWVKFPDRETAEHFLKQSGISMSEPAYLEPTDETILNAFVIEEDTLVIIEGPLPEPLYYRILDVYYQRF